MKTKAKVIGEDGNVFNTLGICKKALERDFKVNEAKVMQQRVLQSGSYEEALSIMQEYVDFK